MSLFGTGRKEAVLAVAILLLLALIQSAPGLFLEQYRQFNDPSGDVQRFAATQLEGGSNKQILLPAMQAAGEAMQAGALPLWNSRARFGEPFDFSGAALLYPPFWLLMLNDAPWALDLLFFLHSAMACAFMFRFLRAITMSRYVAFLGGGSYGLGWFMTVAVDRLPEAAAAALLPFALERTWRCLFSRHRMRTAPLLGLALALMFLTTGSSTAWLGLWLCIGTFIVGIRAIDSFDRPVALRALAVASLVAVTVTSPLILQDLTSGPARRVVEQEPARHLQTVGILGLAAPAMFADIQGHAPEPLLEANPGADPMELALYPGALTIYLLVLGLFRPKRTYQGLMWILVFGAGLLLALNGPIAAFIDSYTGWSADRPGASLVLVHLALVILGSIALDNYLEAPNARRYSVPLSTILCIGIPGSLLVVAIFASSLLSAPLQSMFSDTSQGSLEQGLKLIAYRVAPHALVLALIAIMFLTWRRFGIMVLKPVVAIIALGELCLLSLVEVPRSTNETQPLTASTYIPPGTQRMVAFGRNGRSPSSWLTGHGRSVVNSESNEILDRSSRYMAIIDPSSNYDRSRTQLGLLSQPKLVDHPLMNLAAVHFAISAPRIHNDQGTVGFATPEVETSPVELHKAKHPLPRARLLFKTVAVKTAAKAAEVLAYRYDEVEDLLVLENPPTNFFCQLPSGQPSVEWLEDSPNRIRLKIDMTDGRGYLLLADALAPGWTASVDGETTEILPADLAFRALPIPDGKHSVEFCYRPWAFSLGLPVMLAGLLFGLLCSLRTFRGART